MGDEKNSVHTTFCREEQSDGLRGASSRESSRGGRCGVRRRHRSTDRRLKRPSVTVAKTVDDRAAKDKIKERQRCRREEEEAKNLGEG